MIDLVTTERLVEAIVPAVDIDKYYWFHSTVAQVVAGLLAFLGAIFFYANRNEADTTQNVKGELYKTVVDHLPDSIRSDFRDMTAGFILAYMSGKHICSQLKGFMDKIDLNDENHTDATKKILVQYIAMTQAQEYRTHVKIPFILIIALEILSIVCLMLPVKDFMFTNNNYFIYLTYTTSLMLIVFISISFVFLAKSVYGYEK